MGNLIIVGGLDRIYEEIKSGGIFASPHNSRQFDGSSRTERNRAVAGHLLCA